MMKKKTTTKATHPDLEMMNTMKRWKKLIIRYVCVFVCALYFFHLEQFDSIAKADSMMKMLSEHNAGRHIECLADNIPVCRWFLILNYGRCFLLNK